VPCIEAISAVENVYGDSSDKCGVRRGGLVSLFNTYARAVINDVVFAPNLYWHIRTASTVAVVVMAEYFALVKQIDFDYLYTGMP